MAKHPLQHSANLEAGLALAVLAMFTDCSSDDSTCAMPRCRDVDVIGQ